MRGRSSLAEGGTFQGQTGRAAGEVSQPRAAAWPELTGSAGHAVTGCKPSPRTVEPVEALQGDSMTL